jgi:hypothetical protein
MHSRCNLIKGGLMPGGDGRGPLGLGPGTGRGKGWCKTGIQPPGFGRTMFRGRRGWFLGIAVPVAFAAVRDLANPQGLLRQFAHALASAMKKNQRNISHIAEYTVIEETHPSPKPEKGGREKKQ